MCMDVFRREIKHSSAQCGTEQLYKKERNTKKDTTN